MSWSTSPTSWILRAGLEPEAPRPPAEPGAYLLHLRLAAPARLIVGRLGEFDFPAGDYLYLGSARGPGGLRARLGRHLRGGARVHWHIDYLRQAATVLGVVFQVQPAGDPPLECRWSQVLAARPDARIPAPGFGASDCRLGCPAHLVAFLPGILGGEALLTPKAPRPEEDLLNAFCAALESS